MDVHTPKARWPSTALRKARVAPSGKRRQKSSQGCLRWKTACNTGKNASSENNNVSPFRSPWTKFSSVGSLPNQRRLSWIWVYLQSHRLGCYFQMSYFQEQSQKTHDETGKHGIFKGTYFLCMFEPVLPLIFFKIEVVLLKHSYYDLTCNNC